MKYRSRKARDLLNGEIKNGNMKFNINVIGYIVFFFFILHSSLYAVLCTVMNEKPM